MPLFLAKHGLFFGDYAAAYARLCSIFRGHICPKKAIVLLRMLLFGAYAIYYALILGSNMLSRGDCATAVLLYGRFRLIYSGFGGDIVFFIYLTSSQSVLCKVYVCAHAFIHRKMFRDYHVSHKNWTLFWMIGSKINIM